MLVKKSKIFRSCDTSGSAIDTLPVNSIKTPRMETSKISKGTSDKSGEFSFLFRQFVLRGRHDRPQCYRWNKIL